MKEREENFKGRFYKHPLVLLLLLIIVIKIISLNRGWVEKLYSTGIYVWIGKAYRLTFGWLPVSLGDILYTSAFIYLIYLLIKIIIVAVTGRITKLALYRAAKKTAVVFGIIYILFNINWGLNYNRRGIGYQLKLSKAKYTTEDLVQVTQVLLQNVNETSKALGQRKYPSYNNMFAEAKNAYHLAAKDYPFLRYENSSVKRSLYGRIGNYFGFLGYFNPFTGESQLNLTQPRFLIPFVTCHEMAHQLGYANESEANFVGYVTAINSPNILFHYSTYFDLFNYANGELFQRDSVTAKQNLQQLDTLAKQDVADLRSFYKKYNNPIEPLIRMFYDHYLKANQQERGIKSYNQVVGLLIAYYKKNGKL